VYGNGFCAVRICVSHPAGRHAGDFHAPERYELRNRRDSAAGLRRLSLTTAALDEAGHRVSRYLLTQAIINGGMGLVIGLGLFCWEYPMRCCGSFDRHPPVRSLHRNLDCGLLPFAVSLANLIELVATIVGAGDVCGLRTVRAMVIEPMLVQSSAGTSKLPCLIAIAFWIWLWGPVGLLLATR